MGRFYTVPLINVVYSAPLDAWEIVSGAAAITYLWKIILTQKSDAGDAEDAQVAMQIIRGYTTSGSGGSSATPSRSLPLDSAFSGAVEIGNTTLASAGTADIAHAEAFNVRGGLPLEPVPELRILIIPGQRCVVRLPDTPSNPITLYGTAYLEEVG